MYKLIVFAALVAFAAAKPSLLAYSGLSAPLAYSAPAIAAPLSYSAIAAPAVSYSTHAFAAPAVSYSAIAAPAVSYAPLAYSGLSGIATYGAAYDYGYSGIPYLWKKK